MGVLDRLKQAAADRAAAQAHDAAVAEYGRWHAAASAAWHELQDVRALLAADAAHLDVPLILKRGERPVLVLDGVALIEPRRLPGTYQGRSQGMSFRLAKGVYYRVGQSRGTYVQGAEVPTAIDHGRAVLTSQRVVFHGPKQSREWQFTKLLGVDHAGDAPWTALAVSNRQKVSGLLYPEASRALFQSRLDVALAMFQDRVPTLMAELEREYADLLAAEPPRPAAPAIGP